LPTIEAAGCSPCGASRFSVSLGVLRSTKGLKSSHRRPSAQSVSPGAGLC
jgi:hypothetical protein